MAMANIEVQRLGPAQAHELAPLVAGYVQETRRGAPPQPDDYYTQNILSDRITEIAGARIDGELAGFILFFDLPDFVSGLRVGVIDVFFVRPDRRQRGLGTALIEWISEEGRRRDWSHIRWRVDERTATDSSLHPHVAEKAPWSSYVIHLNRGGDGR
jgi:GNAT superfamily N-acetyltransferase